MPNKDNKDSKEYVNALIAEIAQQQADKEAIIQEFLNTVPVEWTADDIKKKVRDDLLPTAWARMTTILKTTENETLASNLAWKIIGLAIGQVKITDENDPGRSELAELLKSISPDQSQSQANTTDA